MRSSARMVVIASIVAMGVTGSTPSGAAADEPALLRAEDLPKNLRQSTASVSTPSGQTALVVDPATCTEELTESFDGIRDVAAVFRARGSSRREPALLSEKVTTYSSHSSAQRGFEDRANNNDAAEECRTRTAVTLKKIGDDSYASTGGTVDEPNGDIIAITFVSGAYVVEIAGTSSSKSPDLDRLEAVALKAAQRLAQSAAEPSPTVPEADIVVSGELDATLTDTPRCSTKDGVITMTIEDTSPRGTELTLTITDEDSGTAELLVGSTPYEFRKGGFDFSGDAAAFDAARLVWRGDAVVFVDGRASC